MITYLQANSAINEAEKYGLYGADWFWDLGVQRVSEVCNGCGPEWLAPAIREKLTKFLKIFFAAFCIHDCRFSIGNNGLREQFDAANNQLEKNCLILANAHYCIINPLRYVWRHRARVVAAACREFGWSAWRDAYGKSKRSH